jgi:hypothetical protein
MLGIEQIFFNNILAIFGNNIYIFAIFVIALLFIGFMLTGIPLIALAPSLCGILIMVSDITPPLKIIVTLFMGVIAGIFIWGFMQPSR